jgi:predicted  nucleic acid-binding Zn-ribbon protein
MSPSRASIIGAIIGAVIISFTSVWTTLLVVDTDHDKNAYIDNLQAQIKGKNLEIENIKKMKKEFTEEVYRDQAALRANLQECREDYSGLSSRFAALHQRSGSWAEMRADFEQNISSLRSRIAELNTQNFECEMVYEQCRISTENHETEVSDLRQKIERLEEDMKSYKIIMNAYDEMSSTILWMIDTKRNKELPVEEENFHFFVGETLQNIEHYRQKFVGLEKYFNREITEYLERLQDGKVTDAVQVEQGLQRLLEIINERRQNLRDELSELREAQISFRP